MRMRLTKQELDVGIVPSDAEATLAFYRDVIGLQTLPSAPLGQGLLQHRLRIGKHLIKLNQLDRPPQRQRGGIERAVGIRLLALILDDLDAVVGRLQAAGRRYDPLTTGAELPYRVGFTQDPEGNVLELIGLRKPAGRALSTRLQIGLTVADVERSRRFYGETLGLPEEPVMKVGGNVGQRYGFTWGATTVKFWGLPTPPPAQTGTPNAHAGARLFTVMVDDLDATHAELVSKQVPIRMEPTDLGSVARIFFIADPDDNWIEFAQLL
jgi:catechol 2,3-dioxygenase-like lactoylglutathione lyase family enzyme